MVRLGGASVVHIIPGGSVADVMPQCHQHDARFVADRMESMPWKFRGPVAGHYARIFKESGRRDANLYLLRTSERMPGSMAVKLAGSDSELVAYAKRRAESCAREANLRGPVIFDRLADSARAIGITPPEIGGDVTRDSAIARMSDPLWWRRALRKAYGRDVEAAGRDVGLVHKGAGIYSSDETVFRRREQKSRNRRMLEELIAVNELGERFTLAELSDLSVSNPAIRRGELMTRIAGFESVAKDLGHKSLFVTLTCPSRFHSHTIRNYRSVENQHYDGSTPRDAQAYLQRVWARIRARLSRSSITLYGFRVAEPNHDGCVHWHLLVFVAGWALRRVRRVFLCYGLAESPNEPGAQKHRVTFVQIDPAKGTAAGYIAKYIAKNIDGFAMESDLYGNDIIDAVERVDAWAACWGIRQFQQLGGPPVTVWRELRRIEGEESGILESARDAADRGDWAEFVRVMGGPTCPRKSRPVSLAKASDLITFDESTGEVLNASPVVNRYGEPSAAQVIGIKVGEQVTATRWHVWEIEKNGRNEGRYKRQEFQEGGGMVVKEKPSAGFMEGSSDGVGAFGNAYSSCLDSRNDVGGVYAITALLSGVSGVWSSEPWSSVNNCTRHDLVPGESEDEYREYCEHDNENNDPGGDFDPDVPKGGVGRTYYRH